MRFKIGDRVIIIAKHLEHSVHGNFGDVYEIEEMSKNCYISRSQNRTSFDEEVELESVYNSPLYKALL